MRFRLSSRKTVNFILIILALHWKERIIKRSKVILMNNFSLTHCHSNQYDWQRAKYNYCDGHRILHSRNYSHI